MLALMAHERKQIQIKISETADERIETLREQLGMTKIELLSRVCLWFASQSDLVQKLALGVVPRELLPAARDALHVAVSASDPTPADPGPHNAAAAVAAAKQSLGRTAEPQPGRAKTPRSSGGGSVN